MSTASARASCVRFARRRALRTLAPTYRRISLERASTIGPWVARALAPHNGLTGRDCLTKNPGGGGFRSYGVSADLTS